MDYSVYLGEDFNTPKISSPRDVGREEYIKGLAPGYRRLRLDEPRSPLRHQDYQEEIAVTISTFRELGFQGGIRAKDPKFRQALAYFRANLEVYDHIIDHKVFSIGEIYERSLIEGPAFAKYIKKCRAKSLQYKEMIEDFDEDDEHYIEEYSGYDSIIHERYLMFWDETEEVEDWPYALLEEGNFPKEEYDEIVESMLRSYNCIPYEEDDDIRIIDKTANKKSSLNTTKGETTLLKNTWKTEFKQEPWICTRKVVPIHAGNTRDTGVPDIDTLLHIKRIHKHARILSQKIPSSANCNSARMHNRYTRIMKGKWFIHIDFKKFGLTANREIANSIMRMIDKDHLQIPDTYLNIDGDVYKTTRGGGALGWMDPIFALGVSAILYNLRKKNRLKYLDFIIFNDDVEVAIMEDLPEDRVILIKDLICSELERFDFLLSYRKIYCSRMSVFLEEYSNSMYTLNEKLQLAVKPFATSLTAKYHWKAKLYYAEGTKYVRSPWLKELAMNSISMEFSEEEYERPIELGGWTKKIDHFTGLNFALEDASPAELAYFYRMGKFKQPHLMPKWVDIPSEKIDKGRQYLILDARKEIKQKGDLEMDLSRPLTDDDKHRIEELSTWTVSPSSDDMPPPLPTRREVVDFDPG